MNTNIQTVSTEEALSLVADQKRQQILRYLVNNGDGAVDIEEMVASVDRHRSTSGGATQLDNEQFRIELYHKHLPKLAAADVVDYDARSDTIRYYRTSRIEKLLRFITDEFPEQAN